MPARHIDHRNGPFARVADGVRVRIRVIPRSARHCVAGTVPDGDGRTALTVALNSPPIDGKANAALIALLAREWSLPKSALVITGGATGRLKTMHVAGDPRMLLTRFNAWTSERGLAEVREENA